VAFWLETAYSRPFWGIFSPYDVAHRPDPRKDCPWAETPSFEPFSVRICASVRPGGRIEKKRTGQQKSHKSVIFRLFAGSPHWTDSTQKLRGGWCPRHNHVCSVSNWNLHQLQFYRVSNFLIRLLIFAWGLQQCGANALPVKNTDMLLVKLIHHTWAVEFIWCIHAYNTWNWGPSNIQIY